MSGPTAPRTEPERPEYQPACAAADEGEWYGR